MAGTRIGLETTSRYQTPGDPTTDHNYIHRDASHKRTQRAERPFEALTEKIQERTMGSSDTRAKVGNQVQHYRDATARVQRGISKVPGHVCGPYRWRKAYTLRQGMRTQANQTQERWARAPCYGSQGLALWEHMQQTKSLIQMMTDSLT